MRTLWVLFLLLAFASPAAGMPVGAEVESTGPPGPCVHPEPEACFATHEDRPGTGEDRLAAGRDVERASLTANVPGAGPTSVDLNGQTVALDHPEYVTANKTWPALNETTPGDTVTFEQRQKRSMSPGSRAWGVWVVVHSPIILPSGERYVSTGYCSPQCFTSGADYIGGDADTLVLAPHGLVIEMESSDVYVLQFRAAGSPCYWSVTQRACPADVVLAPHRGGAFDLYDGLVPDANLTARARRADLNVNTDRTDNPVDRPTGWTNRFSELPRLVRDRVARFLGVFLPNSTIELGTVVIGIPPSESRPIIALGLTTASPIASVSDSAPPAWQAVALSVAAGAAFLFALAVYARISRESALRQPTRRAIFALVRSNPGLHLEEIARNMAIDESTVRYQVGRLRGFGLVVTHGTNPVRVFAVGDAAAGRMICALANPTSRRVYDALQAADRVTQADLVAALGLPQYAVSRALSRLRGAGIVAQIGRRNVVYSASPHPATTTFKPVGGTEPA